MTVAELIKKLKKYPSDMKVLCRSYNSDLLGNPMDVSELANVNMSKKEGTFYDAMQDKYFKKKTYTYDENGENVLVISDIK